MSQRNEAYPPIEGYGVIGNCHTAALISGDGAIDWLCLPRFDSSSIFARVLDWQRGGYWQIHPEGPFESEHHYVEHTNVLHTTFSTPEGRVRLIDFMPVALASEEGTRNPPALLVRIVEGLEGEVAMEALCAPRPDYARATPRIVVEGQTACFDQFEIAAPAPWHLDTATNTLRSALLIRAGERVAFTFLAEDGADREAARQPERLLEKTTEFWLDWAAQCTYQGAYREQVMRSVLALKMLTHTPTGAIVAAPTTSLPEEIGGMRNWDYRFTWIRDASFTLYALLLAGYEHEDDAFFRWIVRTVQMSGTGIHILYPISPETKTEEQELTHLEGYRGSAPVRIGNGADDQLQLDVYGEVLDALHFAWKVGNYDPGPVWDHFRPLIDWVAHNWNQPENGIWEVRGGQRHFVFGKVMCWVALDRGVDMAEELGMAGDLDLWRAERDRIHADVMERGWSTRLNSFKQSYEDEQLDASNLLLSVVGFIEGDHPRMQGTIDATLRELVTHDVFCYRYLDAPEGVTGNEGSFVLCTFWLIDALILAGRIDEARKMFDTMLAKATPLGLFAEEIDATTGAHLGNFPQAFSHIGVINAAVSLAHAGATGKIAPEVIERVARCRSGIAGMRITEGSAVDEEECEDEADKII